jgi:hypothetical protein
MNHSINLRPTFRFGFLLLFLAALALGLGFPFQSAIEGIILLGRAALRYSIDILILISHLGRRIGEFNHLGDGF